MVLFKKRPKVEWPQNEGLNLYNYHLEVGKNFYTDGKNSELKEAFYLNAARNYRLALEQLSQYLANHPKESINQLALLGLPAMIEFLPLASSSKYRDEIFQLLKKIRCIYQELDEREDCNKAQSLNNSVLTYLFNIGSLLLHEDYMQLKDLFIGCQIDMGIRHYHNQRYQRATQTLRLALDFSPINARKALIFYFLGLTYAEECSFSKAKSFFHKVFALDLKNMPELLEASQKALNKILEFNTISESKETNDIDDKNSQNNVSFRASM